MAIPRENRTPISREEPTPPSGSGEDGFSWTPVKTVRRLGAVYRLCTRYFFGQNHKAQRAVVEAARHLWERGEGHPLLAEIGDHGRRHWSWSRQESTEVFGDRFFARSRSNDAAEQLRYQQTESDWIDEGRTPLPAYFEAFGVVSAKRRLRELEEEAREEAARQQHRTPTPTEAECIALLTQVVRGFAPGLMAFFDGRRTVYSVAETDVLLGELKEARQYRSREVFLSSKVFVADLAGALAVFLHEHAHIFGWDGSRGFSDALTELLEAVVRARNALDQAESKWEALREQVAAERSSAGEQSEDGLFLSVDSMSEAEMRTLLRRIPAPYLHSLLDENRPPT